MRAILAYGGSAKAAVAAIAAIAAFSGSVAHGGVTFRETFTGGSNEGGWSYFGDPNTGVEVTEASGGNPGAWRHATCQELKCLDTFAPQARTQLGVSSEFTGNYRERGVASVGIDLILLDVDFSAGGRPLTVMLSSDGGTPDNFEDDVVVYSVGATNVPVVGDGWRTFDFGIPSGAGGLPKGWRVLFGPGDDNANWNAAITDVDQLGFFYGDPEFFFIFQQWEPGMDNPRITYAAPFAIGDMNCDGSVTVSDIGPFVLALTNPTGYAAQFPNCDIGNGDTNNDGTLTVGDIGGFVTLLTGG